ncbi:GNAT family N-acetyltransferase [Phormidium sp. CLA17]|nr:GNAT family N-acetyltransferase [Leptolyngbya sp. Cla-17]
MLLQPLISNLTLRRAIAGDGNWAAPLLFSICPALFSYIFASTSEQAQDVLQQAFVYPGHAFSYEHTCVIEIQGQPVGLMIGYPAVIKRQADEKVHGVMARITPLRKLPRILINVADFNRIKQDISSEDYYLLGVGILPEFRNQGLGTYLLAQVEAQAQAADCQAICLDITYINSCGRRFFERNGYCITLSKTTDRFEQFTRSGGIHRMAKYLI